MKDWQENYACGCVAEFDRLADAPGMCGIHKRAALGIRCTDPIKFETELKRIGKATTNMMREP